MDKGIDRVTWKSRNAWWCIFFIVVSVFAVQWGIAICAQMSPDVARWHRTLLFRLGRMVFVDVLPVPIALFCSRDISVKQFLEHVGLTRRPSLFGWSSAWAAIGIGLFSLYNASKGWTSEGHISASFHHGGSGARWFYVIYVTALFPILEEVVMRGFIYRAFRGSYPQFVSTLLVLSIVTFMHWSAVWRGPATFLFIETVAVVLCVIRERSGSLWNCIIFHAAYNGTAVRMWPACVIGLVLLLPAVGKRSE